MEWIDILYLINVFCVWFSWRIASWCFDNDNDIGGYLNLFASALNAVIIANHFL